MEELQQNLFIKLTLPQSFNPQLWQAIAEQPPEQFQAQQLDLYRLLIKDASLKEKYFQKFEKNHLTLYGWYLLSSREKIDIQPYLLKNLLHKTPSFHNHNINKAIHSSFPHRSSRTEPSQIRKVLVNPRHFQPKDLPVEEEINSHELYLQTFAACRGERYIPYDHSRHMKSGKERNHYNAFIRQQHKRNVSNPSQSVNILAKYKEWTLMKEKTSLLCFRSVLGDVGMNSERGLQTLLKRQGSQKLVFVNHQRKPINYYLRSQLSRQKA